MTDASGNLTYKGQFDPYGAALIEWSNSGNTNLNNKKFTGYERDNSGMDYANARMYNSTRGRFTTPDIKGLSGANVKRPETLNRYAYSSSDPVNYLDPTGLDDIPTTDYVLRINSPDGTRTGGFGSGSDNTSLSIEEDSSNGNDSDASGSDTMGVDFPSINMDEIRNALNMANDLLKRKECDEALKKDYGIDSLKALLDGLTFSGANANVFDGRTSSLSLPIGPNGSQQTVADYFKANKGKVGASVFHNISGKGDGDVTFLGFDFFSPEQSQWISQQQAIMLLHEAVHQVGKKGDAAFGGSKALSEKIIDGCYPVLKGKLGGVG